MDLEKKKKQVRKACGFRKCQPSHSSEKKRPHGKGWIFVQTEDGRLAWIRIRKLTPRECFRLMDVDEHYIDKIQSAGISDSQQYKMAGNSICVGVMEKGIFYNLFATDRQEECGQLTLF